MRANRLNVRFITNFFSFFKRKDSEEINVDLADAKLRRDKIEERKMELTDRMRPKAW